MNDQTKQRIGRRAALLTPKIARIRRAITSYCLVILLGVQCIAQQPAPTITQLKEQIARMELIDRDANTSEEVRHINQGFLRERRVQLQSLIMAKLEALRKYQGDLDKSLSSQEQQVIANAIQELDQELRLLKNSLPPSKVTESPAGETVGNGSTGTSSSQMDSQTPQITTSSVGERPGDSSLGARVNEVAPMMSATTSLQANCYSDAPPILIDTSTGAAFRVVDGGAGAIRGSLQRLIFFTLADAVSSAEMDKTKSDLIRSIRIQQFMEETARTDKQTGASATSDGTTSMAEKPNFANLLAFAVEHGAIQKQVNGTTLTLSTSPYAFIAASQGDTSSTYKKYDFFHRIGVSANFNIEDQNNVLASARRSQLAEWSVRGRFTRDRSTRSAEFEDFWNREIRSTFERVPLVLVTEFSDLFSGETQKVRLQVVEKFVGYAQQYLDNNASLSVEAKRAGLQQEILCKLKQDVFDKINSFGLTDDDRARIVSKTLPALRSATEGERSALELVKNKIKEMNNRPLATFAYTNKREAAGSDYSILKFLYEKKTFSPMKIVANAGMSMYHKPNRAMNQQTVRDLALALSLEGKAGRSPFLNEDLDQSQITFAFTGRYERMFENARIPGRKADLSYLQFRVEVPFMSGMSLPFSVTYANATELIKEDHIRANFGFSFDADKLFLIKNFLKP
jgi:hypothetical protein